MGQTDIIKILEKKQKHIEEMIELVNDSEKKLEILWKESLRKDDISLLVGTSITSVAKGIQKLILRDQIISIENDIDKRKRRYIIKNETNNKLVNPRRDKC